MKGIPALQNSLRICFVALLIASVTVTRIRWQLKDKDEWGFVRLRQKKYCREKEAEYIMKQQEKK